MTHTRSSLKQRERRLRRIRWLLPRPFVFPSVASRKLVLEELLSDVSTVDSVVGENEEENFDDLQVNINKDLSFMDCYPSYNQMHDQYDHIEADGGIVMELCANIERVCSYIDSDMLRLQELIAMAQCAARLTQIAGANSLPGKPKTANIGMQTDSISLCDRATQSTGPGPPWGGVRTKLEPKIAHTDLELLSTASAIDRVPAANISIQSPVVFEPQLSIVIHPSAGRGATILIDDPSQCQPLEFCRMHLTLDPNELQSLGLSWSDSFYTRLKSQNPQEQYGIYGVCIREVKVRSYIDRWNNTHPDFNILSRDILVEINGRRCNSRNSFLAMVSPLRKDPELTIIRVRGESPFMSIQKT